MKSSEKPLILAVLAAITVATAACSGSSSNNPLETALNDPSDLLPVEVQSETNELIETDSTGIIESVAIGDIPGIFFTGTPPETIGSITLTPLVDAGEPIEFISGGSTQVALESDTPFVTAFVVADEEGFFQIDLAEAQTVADLIISFSTIQLEGQIDEIDVSVQSAGGDISAAEQLPVSSVLVGTGELQISVSWDTPSDVDLAVIEPDGTIIDFANETSSSGGMLDLDSNAACFIDGVNNENITYESVTPPSGEYVIEVDYFLNCGVPTPTNYVVTLRSGDSVQTFAGTFQPDDDSFEIPATEVARFQIP